MNTQSQFSKTQHIEESNQVIQVLVLDSLQRTHKMECNAMSLSPKEITFLTLCKIIKNFSYLKLSSSSVTMKLNENRCELS